MQAAVADTHKPNLCVRVASKQAVRCRQSICSHLEGPGVDIESNDFAVVACFHLRPYLSLIDFIAASGGFFFTIARRRGGLVCVWFSLLVLSLFDVFKKLKCAA